MVPSRTLAKYRQALILPRSELRLLVRAFVTVALVDVGLKLCGFAGLLRVVACRSRPVLAPLRRDALDRAARYARFINMAANNHIVTAHCLHRSLALHAWLTREGLPSELRIGVRSEYGRFSAHAWVELNGHPANELPERIAMFKPLLSHPGGHDWLHFNGKDGINEFSTTSQQFGKAIPWNR